MTDISVSELLMLIGEQQVQLRYYEKALESAADRITELEDGSESNSDDND